MSEVEMLISRALAGHGVADTGSSGGGNALLIILEVVILLGLVHMGRKKLRAHLARRDGER